MAMPNPDVQAPVAPEPPPEAAKQVPQERAASTRVPSIIVGAAVAVVTALSIWYLVRPQPLLVQGEVDATRFDIAARVDGRVAKIPIVRGEDVAAGAVLVRIDNPETIAKNEQAVAAKVVAEAQLANIKAGTRVETIAARKAALERAEASVVLAQKTYDRVSQLAEHGNAPIARFDQATDTLHESQRAVDQARSAMSRPSTATRKRSARSPRRTSARRSPTSRLYNRSSIRWWCMHRSPRRSISATWSPANTWRLVCRW
jgi:HlyD family secretion protein